MIEPGRAKQAGAAFWNANPCGGDWDSPSAFMEWMRTTEPYLYQRLDAFQWSGRRVLEVGCGQGTTLNYLPGHGAHMVGIDMSAASLRRASEAATALGHGDRVRVVLADAERLPFPDGHFDAAVSIGVLHHTPDTAAGILEVLRVLKPGGLAVVMLYRSGNPKWWATRLLRSVSGWVERVAARPGCVLERLRARQRAGDASGTALLELFGVPVLRAYSNRQARALFGGFSRVSISNHQPGFRRLADVAPALRPLSALLAAVDRRTVNAWGFYQVIEAQK